MKKSRNVVLGLLFIAGPVWAQEPGPAETAHADHQEHANHAAPPPPASEPSDAMPEKLSVTHHQVTVNGRVISYTATAGYLTQKDEEGKPHANIFFTAYTRDPAGSTTAPATQNAGTQPRADTGGRPITFLFNGGPGAASVWLHLGAAGPMRLDIDENGDVPSPPFKLVDNPSTWLDATDLVFIDPVGTGYSRAAAGQDPKAFYGVKEDLESIGAFIRLYTTRYQRWASPKFLAGESYGTTRAAALSGFLADRYGIAVNGVILISSVLNFQTLSPDAGNDLPYALYLPSYTAVAWYHKKLPADLQADLGKALGASEAFALDRYTVALGKGSSLSADDRAKTLDELTRLTGLPRDYIDRSNLRIPPARFQHELLAGDQRVLGRFDARITGPVMDPPNDSAEYDPSLAGFFEGYTSAFSDYVRGNLQYANDLPYETLTGRVHPWDFSSATGGNGFLNVADDLRNTLIKHPHMRVLINSAHFDLATPYLGTIYTINHLDLPTDLRGNITQAFYDAGHMLYHPKTELMKLHEQVAGFIEKAGHGS